ncbi:nitroreductase [Candidatus Acidulodesulfobacterium sp. H_13]|uniref:nitroreductase n=1 Tax=Candidatus Acidulodesulfobacterium sp. H_13 TaxID=3395470 RepID=UPI003AF8E17D
MNLAECISTRSSKRDFKNIPVPKDLIFKLIEISSHAPSWANSQPWKVAAATGKTSEFIKENIYKMACDGNMGTPDFPFPESWPKEQSDNIFETGKNRYESIGILRSNEEKRREIMLSNYLFFGSQTALFVYIDETLGHWSVLDCGIFIQNILLVAHDMGLGACPQAYLVRYPDVLREAFNLDNSKKFLLGISIGYVKKESPVNNIKTAKMKVDDILKYYE